MISKKHIQTFEQHQESLNNFGEKELLEYEKGIELYKRGLENIEEAMILFENSPWGIPEELNNLFGERQGNENLYTLQKEVSHLKEDMDNYN